MAMGYWEAITAQRGRITPQVKNFARRGGEQLLDLVFPPRSLLTGKPVSQKGVEAELWGALRFLDEPCCACCGYPFDYKVPDGTQCPACVAWPPGFDRARAAFIYDPDSRGLVLRFKHGGQTDGLPVFARQMSRAGRKILSEADMFIPVPLHPRRLRQRKFNQAALLTRQLSRTHKVPARYDILQRVKNTPSQGHRTAAARRRNVQGAFSVPKSVKEEVKGKCLILIDDVYTTGATLTTCAKTLKRAGAARVDALTLARVVKPQTAPT